jgi:fucose 4-O-acetylase-like acetyltransferase
MAIILVLYRHVFEGLKQSGLAVSGYTILEQANILFFSFRMPLFFIVSGMFIQRSLQKRSVGSLIASKAKTILYPYFLWASVQILLQLIFSRYVNTQRSIRDFTYLFYLPREIEQFWYLYALFNVTVLFTFSKVMIKIKTHIHLLVGIILYYLGALAFQKNIIIGFAGDILHYYIFFVMGDMVSGFFTNRENFKRLESFKTFFILLPPFIILQAYFLITNLDYAEKKYQYVEYFQPFMFLLIALSGCIFIIQVSFILQKYKVVSWLQVLGRHSLYIYVLHVMILAAARIIMVKLFRIYNIPVLLGSGTLLGLVMPVIIYNMAVKLNMKWLFSLENNKSTLLKNR